MPDAEGLRSSDNKFCIFSMKIHTTPVLYHHGFHHKAFVVVFLNICLLGNRNVSFSLYSFNEYLLNTSIYQALGYRQIPRPLRAYIQEKDKHKNILAYTIMSDSDICYKETCSRVRYRKQSELYFKSGVTSEEVTLEQV